MKKIFILAATFIAAPLLANDVSGHTFFSIVRPYHGAQPEKISFFRDRMTAKENGYHGTFQIVPFGGKSMNERELAQFFMPFGKTQLNVGEFNSATVNDGSVDVMANYFGVLTQPFATVYPGAAGLDSFDLTYQSKLFFAPEHSYAGVGFSYRQRLSKTEEKGWFFDIHFPVVKVKNTVGFKEVIDNAGGGDVATGYVGSIEDALKGNTVFGNQQFKYGKIPCNPCDKLEKTGVGDIELAFGYENKECACFHRNAYFGVVIPTGNKPTGEYIFEPIVGNNKHFGLQWGGQMSYEMWSNDIDKSLTIHYNMHSQYLFKNTQKRSFDLVDKQWSRYMWMYPNSRATSVADIEPGINHLTLDVEVTPRSSFNMNTALVYDYDHRFRLEGGYNVFTRQPENICLHCPFTPSFGIAGIDEADTDNAPLTKSNASIRHFLASQSIENDVDPANGIDPIFIEVTEADLDFNSVAMPCKLSSMFYVAARYGRDDLRVPTIAGLGFSYKWSPDNAGLENWAVWGKLALSF